MASSAADGFQLFPSSPSVHWCGGEYCYFDGNLAADGEEAGANELRKYERDSEWIAKASAAASTFQFTKDSAEKEILERAMRIALYICTSADPLDKLQSATRAYGDVIAPLATKNPGLYVAIRASQLQWFFARNVLARNLRDERRRPSAGAVDGFRRKEEPEYVAS